MASGEDDIQVQMLPEDEDKVNGVEENAAGALDDDDDDVDGQAVDPTRARPKKRNLYFVDGQRSVDFVLAWNAEPDEDDRAEAEKAREIFEKNLQLEGLQLEYDKRGIQTHFVKVHAPYEVLRRYADILKIRLSMKESLVVQHGKKFQNLQGSNRNHEGFEDENPVHSVSTQLWGAAGRVFQKFMSPFHVDREALPAIKRKYTCPYAADKEYLFDIPQDKNAVFTPATRSWIVDFILRRKSFAEDDQKAYSFGVNKMIADEYYDAAFPLHEGHWKEGAAENERKLLFGHWASWRNFYKFQPLDYVRHYFGEKIGMYFAWLGFYLFMLIPASVVGIIVFIYGLSIMYSNVPTQEVCDDKTNLTMCPLCDVQCPYWNLHETCDYVAASRLFDNYATVIFAIFMSMWGTLFLEFWKRKEATIQYKWDLTNFVSAEEPPRPEYLSKLENWQIMKINPVTGLKEPHLPFWRQRFPIFLCSYSVMIFLASIAIMSVVGVIAYRVSVLAALQLGRPDLPDNSSEISSLTVNLVYKNASLVTTITAALINLIIIIILNYVYGLIAFKLTDWECLRTQSEYDNSITIKLFLLQFVNYFSSIFYIAFFKGRFVGRPGAYNTIFGARQEECQAGGCLIELCIQLAIIMVGKQLIQNNLIEIIIPRLIKLLKKWCAKETKEQKLASTAWEKDFKLQPASNTSLFYEYLEMVLQFGFLTIFSAAFPLAPVFALLNNIVEIRVDANKFITQLRRPVAERAATIGVWYSVLYAISRLAVVSNAFIIALTSDFIPRLVYKTSYSPDHNMVGYVNFSLSYFNTSDFQPQHRPAPALQRDVQVCRYRDFRYPPGHEDEYAYSDIFWHILASRLAFVVVFENVVVVVTSLIAWLIPDVPVLLKEQIRREAYITNEIVLRTELQRAQGINLDAGQNGASGGVDSESYNSERYSPQRSDIDIEMDVRHRAANSDHKTYM